MAYNTKDYFLFGLCPSFGILKTQKNTTFRKPDMFPSSGEGATPYLLSPLESDNLRVLVCQNDWRLTANQFVLAPGPLRLSEIFFATESSPYVLTYL
jgi:hypothetical protein